MNSSFFGRGNYSYDIQVDFELFTFTKLYLVLKSTLNNFTHTIGQGIE